jgi:hypothetical protein
MSESESSLLPILNEACHHHHSRAHSDPQWDPLDDRWVHFAKNRHGISQSSLFRFHRGGFPVRAGTHHNQGGDERALEMVELGHLTSAQINYNSEELQRGLLM